jgi:membrane associated rhomboid family serine protease
MIPLRDENPTRSIPVVTVTLILINVVVFLYQMMYGLDASAVRYGLIPAELVHGADTLYRMRGGDVLPPEAVRNLDPSWLTVLTSMFLHGSWLHILGNMWFLWIFGNNVEDSMGKGKFVLFYLGAGVAAAALQTVISPGSQIPMIGASGAVAGVLGAYAMMFPGAQVLCLIPLGFVFFTRDLPAWIVLGFWFVIELFRGLGALGVEQAGGVAYAAHVGGFVFGLLLGRSLGGLHPQHGGRHPRAPSRDYMDWR